MTFSFQPVLPAVHRQYLRFLLAAAGAIIITGSMLILMAQFSAMFSQRSGDKIFMIDDILPAPERGRPVRPPAAALPPRRETPDIRREEAAISVEGLDPDRLNVESAPVPPSIEADEPVQN